MTICPTCASRNPGDPVCALHPEASAFWDRQRYLKGSTMEDLQDRIYTIVEEALPLSSTGLNVLGFDVVFGNWDVNGKLTAAYAIVIVARAPLPGGAVLLDGGPADVQIQIIGQTTAEGPAGDFYPSDKAIRAHVTTACDVMRQKVTQRQAPSNGGAAAPNPFTEALKKYQEGRGDK